MSKFYIHLTCHFQFYINEKIPCFFYWRSFLKSWSKPLPIWSPNLATFSIPSLTALCTFSSEANSVNFFTVGSFMMPGISIGGIFSKTWLWANSKTFLSYLLAMPWGEFSLASILLASLSNFDYCISKRHLVVEPSTL